MDQIKIEQEAKALQSLLSIEDNQDMAQNFFTEVPPTIKQSIRHHLYQAKRKEIITNKLFGSSVKCQQKLFRGQKISGSWANLTECSSTKCQARNQSQSSYKVTPDQINLRNAVECLKAQSSLSAIQKQKQILYSISRMPIQLFIPQTPDKKIFNNQNLMAQYQNKFPMLPQQKYSQIDTNQQIIAEAQQQLFGKFLVQSKQQMEQLNKINSHKRVIKSIVIKSYIPFDKK